MSLIVKNLPKLINNTSSGGTNIFTNGIGHLDDANSVTLFFVSTANAVVTSIQVSQFDPADPTPQVGVSESTGWNSLSTAVFAGVLANTNFSSSGNTFTFTNIAFRGIRIGLTASSSFSGDVIAFASKSISV